MKWLEKNSNINEWPFEYNRITNWRTDTEPTLYKSISFVQLNFKTQKSCKWQQIRTRKIRYWLVRAHNFIVHWQRNLLLLLTAESHLLWNVLLRHFLQHILQLWITDVHQHVGIGTVFHCHIHIIIMATIIMIYCFLFCASWYDIIIKFAPLQFTTYRYDCTLYNSKNFIPLQAAENTESLN